MAETYRQRRIQDHRAGTGLSAGISSNRPIGVFDSGIGGLSVLNALRAELPHERFVYFADTAHAPYGERGDAYVIERSRAVANQLRSEHDIKALVVACNTATAAAIHVLRAEHPGLVLIGVEPALKPAVAQSATRHIAVLATRGTLDSQKFRSLLASMATQAEFSLVPCDGLADAIERDDSPRIALLCDKYIAAAGTFGVEAGHIDTLVLGCTHYPFIANELRLNTGNTVRFIDTGGPVAQQTRRLLEASGLLAREGQGSVDLVGTSNLQLLQDAAVRWLSASVGETSSATVASAGQQPETRS